ncbi:MAG: hypothetical protein HZA78_04345 [Candidatus Schekmanbacteria bacterium]|nr:hypothetical protein [Candidatus Schekmanbacteria bacterium]
MDFDNIKLSINATEPKLWVSRLLLFASIKPVELLREISLQRGLNIIWGVDEDDASDDLAIVLGHGVGKTGFCRLLRYCLGESTFGTESTREQIRLTFPHGYVAAQIHVCGEQWAVARPIGHRGHSYAAKEVSIEELLENRPSIDSYHKFQTILGNNLLNDLPVGTVSGTDQPIKWENLLAWCTRDQEARYQNIWQWRSPRSDAETPTFDRPKADSFFLMRTVLGLLTGEEASIAENLREINTRIVQAKEEIDEKQKAPEYLCQRYTQKLKGILNIAPAATVSFEPDNLFGIPQLVKNEETWLISEINGFDKEIAALDTQIADISAIINELNDGVNHWSSLLRLAEISSDVLNENQEERKSERKFLEETIKNKTCRHAQIKLEDCNYVNKYLNSRNIQEQYDSREEKKLIENRQVDIPKLKTEIDRYKTDLGVHQKQRQKLLFTKYDFEHKREAFKERKRKLNSTYQELISWKAVLDGTQPDLALSQLADKLNQLNQEKQTIEEQLNNLLQAHDEHLDNLRKIFDCVVKMSLSEKFKGLITFKQGELDFQIVHGKTMAGEAIETLKILLADITAVILGMSGSGYHPSFLLHDSPREADLGARIYSNFLRFIEKLHISCGGSDKASFQYIVTTTTPPPPALQTEEFVKLKLNARNEADMLFCRNIGLMNKEGSDSQQLSLGNL